jgi:type I restriction enzyme S subunit
MDQISEVRLGRQRSPKNHTGTQMRRYLRAANVTWDGVDISDVKEMNFTDDEVAVYRLREGDLLLSEASGSAKEVGKPAVWRSQLVGDVCFQNTLIRVRPEAGINSDFLYYRLLHEAMRGGFVASSRGVGIHHLGSAKLAAFSFDLPSTEEQQHIAETIRVQLAQVSAALNNLNALERHMQAARRSIIQRVCLGSFRVPGTEHQAAPASSPPGVEVPEDVPAVPPGWTWSTLGELAAVVGGVTKDSKKQDDPEFVEVPYLRVANVQEGALRLDSVTTIRVSASKAEALRLLPGDVLMNEGGDRDKLGRGWVWEGQIPNCIHQNHVFRARVQEGRIDPRLLSWHGNTFGRAWFEANGKQTTNLASISLTNAKRLPVPVPPVEEQVQMVDYIERHLEMLDMATTGVSVLRRRCEALRRSILAAAFSGGVRLQSDGRGDTAALLSSIEAARAATADTRKPRTATRTQAAHKPQNQETPA